MAALRIQSGLLTTFVMGKEDFIKDALHNPSDYIAYHVGRELAQLHPGKAILEGMDGSFDLEEYVCANKCALVHETAIFNHLRTDWPGSGRKLKDVVENSWLNVLWRGQLLDVLFLSFSEGCYRARHHWIVAEDRKLAEEFFYEVCAWNSEVRGEVLVFEDGEWEKSKELYSAIKSATFDNLILRDSLKEDLQNDFTRFFASREVYEQYGIPWKRGALFIGPPGNGKTHTVKALINQLQQPCLYVKGFKASYGTEQECMRRVFERARRTTPCLVVMEDIDSMIDDKNRSFFLNELDGFSANTGVVVLGTTNHPERLDTAILERPSRFDRKYYFALPELSERGSYVAVWNDNLQPALRIPAATALEIVKQTEGFSFAYLKELVLSAMMQWMAGAGAVSMDEVMLDQVSRLRAEMKAAKNP
jgi:AAA+ superfamily predicted ATPase